MLENGPEFRLFFWGKTIESDQINCKPSLKSYSVINALVCKQGKGDYMDKLGVTILAEDSSIGDEVVVSCCIVLPHKRLSHSVQNDIIL